VLIFFIAGLLYLLRFKRVDNLGAYSIPSETGLLIPSVNNSHFRFARRSGTIATVAHFSVLSLSILINYG